MNTEDIELKMLTEALYLKYGYDFRGYAEASLKRRLKLLMGKEQVSSLSHLQHALLHDPGFFARSVAQFTVPTSEMFRDAAFFRALRTKVIPVLKTYPAVKIWHAGCSTGEEVHSLAIILKEEGLYDRCVIYATDISSPALQTAREGIYAAQAVQHFTAAYHAAGGNNSFSDYYTALYGSVRFEPKLRENVVFSEHNLATDEVFSEMHLILCRNVLIYFQRPLQDRALDLFARSLVYKGFLGLGSKESVRFVPAGQHFLDFSVDERLYQNAAADRTTAFGGDS